MFFCNFANINGHESHSQATERIKKVFQKELKKAMNALNSSKAALLMIPTAPSTAPVVTYIQPETVIKATPLPVPAAAIVKREIPPKSSAPTVAVLTALKKTLKAPPVRTASSSSANTVTTSIQFSGYETRCDVILRALVRHPARTENS